MCLSFQLISATHSDYEILAYLGKGEKAEFFLAKTSQHQFVVIKRMYAKEQFPKSSPEFQEYLDAIYETDGTSKIAIREFEIGQALDHPNIIKMKEMYTERDRDGHIHSYLVMDFVNGKTLHETDRYSHTRNRSSQRIGFD